MTRKAHAVMIVLSTALLSTLILLTTIIVHIWLFAGPVVDMRL